MGQVGPEMHVPLRESLVESVQAVQYEVVRLQLEQVESHAGEARGQHGGDGRWGESAYRHS